jgi:uncharacterized protein YkwD
MKTYKTIISLSAALLLAASALPALAASSPTAAAPAPALTPSEVIGRINGYRLGNGLYEYKHNSTLMALAQGQADYMASTGTVTHTGPGGTRPIDRAYNANYGSGNKIFVSEIIYGGYQSSVDTAITWWKNSSLHNDQMLASTYLEIGAGVATAGERTYYVAVMGWVTGIAAPSDAGAVSPTAASGDDLTVNAAPAFIAAVPVVKATPNPDGSIVHIIRTGQALWTLAAVYEVPLEVLLAQNELPEWAFVHPGDEIIIQPPSGEAPVEAPTASSGETGGNAQEVIGAPSEEAAAVGGVVGEAVSGGVTPEAASGSQAETIDSSEAPPENLSSPARWIVAGAFIVLVIVVLGSLFFQSPPARPEDNDPVR